MRIYVLTVLFCLQLAFAPLVSKAVSTGELSGKIIDSITNQPIAYAELILENNFDKITITADEYGEYCADIPEGKYQVKVNYNEKLFILNKVKVYYNYASIVNIYLSSNAVLPDTVILPCVQPKLVDLAPPVYLLAFNGDEFYYLAGSSSAEVEGGSGASISGRGGGTFTRGVSMPGTEAAPDMAGVAGTEAGGGGHK